MTQMNNWDEFEQHRSESINRSRGVTISPSPIQSQQQHHDPSPQYQVRYPVSVRKPLRPVDDNFYNSRMGYPDPKPFFTTNRLQMYGQQPYQPQQVEVTPQRPKTPFLGSQTNRLWKPTKPATNNQQQVTQFGKGSIANRAKENLMKFSSGTQSIASRLKSAFSITSLVSQPPGLRNDGANICFQNSILQCLAHGTNLSGLVRTSEASPTCSAEEEDFVCSFRELILRLDIDPRQNRQCIMDTSSFQSACLVVGCDLLAEKCDEQNQQDAAEYLTWLLQALHTAMDLAKSNGNISTNRHYSPTLAMLSFIYGDLTAKRIEDLKKACRRTFESLNAGLDNEHHTEAVQRLADLEWLTYKQTKKSVVDDLFTGQIVEELSCLSCKRVTVTAQPFNILPLPIVPSSRDSGIVHLDDCFSKFGTIENLFGPDGLQCPCSNKEFQTPSEKPAADIKNTLQGRHSDSAVGSPITTFSSLLQQQTSTPAFMSPILKSDVLGDSGYQDNTSNYRTSTPILSDQAPSSGPVLTNGERRCLLRQLPECLVIQLMRFRYSTRHKSIRKIHTPINIPLKNLDLSSLVFDNVTSREDLTASVDCCEYELCGVCVHLGGEATDCGHYLSYCQSKDGSWYKFDDESVTRVNMEYELYTKTVREESYLLFYRKSKNGVSTQNNI